MDTKPALSAIEIPADFDPKKPVVLQVVVSFLGNPSDKRFERYESFVSYVLKELLVPSVEALPMYEVDVPALSQAWILPRFRYTILRQLRPIDMKNRGETTVLQSMLFRETPKEYGRINVVSATIRRAGAIKPIRKSS